MAAEFCKPGCGLSANCAGPVTEESVTQVSVAKRKSLIKNIMGKSLRSYENWGTYSVLTDAEGRTSEVIPTGRKTPQEVVKAIGECAGPRRSVCGAFPEISAPYEETPAAKLINTQEMQEKLAITEGNR